MKNTKLLVTQSGIISLPDNALYIDHHLARIGFPINLTSVELRTSMYVIGLFHKIRGIDVIN